VREDAYARGADKDLLDFHLHESSATDNDECEYAECRRATPD
jgi:hypothetical protein